METFELDIKQKLENTLKGFQVEFLNISKTCFWYKVFNDSITYTIMYDIFSQNWFVINKDCNYKPKPCNLNSITEVINNVS